MTWFWAEGLAVQVETTGQGTLPVAFIWMDARHPVAGIVMRWRVDHGWWEERIWRDYFRLHTETGLLVVLYHDLTANRWALERLYD